MKKTWKECARSRWCIYSAFILITLFFACSIGSIPTKNYYIINYTPFPHVPATSNRPYPYSIQVGRFKVQRIFNRHNIIYRYSPLQIQYYELERWAVRPDYMITDMVFKHLEASNLTNRIGIDFFDTKPDFRIEGTVEAIEKLDAGDLFYGHIAMTFKMLRVQDGEQIWNYSFDQRKQVYSRDMVHSVRALSSILQSQMDVVVSQLDSLFLSMESGAPPVEKTEIIPPETAPEDKTGMEIDESAFEIIPEKKK